MSKAVKIWLAIGAILLVIGAAMFTWALAGSGWDFSNLKTVEYETNTYEIQGEFSDISLDLDITDVLFVTAEDDVCRVVCYETETVWHTVDVRDGVLTVECVDDREWHDFVGIETGVPKVTVYLPKSEYAALNIRANTSDIEIPEDFAFDSVSIKTSTGDVDCCAAGSEFVKIETSTGDIRLENIETDALDLSVSTGDITVSDIVCHGDATIIVSTGETNIRNMECRSFGSGGGTGDISMKDLTVVELLCIERSTGDIYFDACDAAEILIETSTGDVTGSLRSEKIFHTDTSSGDVSVPYCTAGGRCDIITSSGDIDIVVK